MKSLFYSLFVTALAVLPAQAKDLAEGQVIGNITRNISIQEVVEARIAKEDVKVHGAGENKSAFAQAIIEVTLRVEGNLCGSNPDEASMIITRTENYDAKLSLAYLDHENDPYKLIMKACLAYSAPRTVKAVFSVSSSLYKDHPEHKAVYTIGEKGSERKLTYTHTIADGIKLSLE